jgi:tetratricopeptide (TPR) repeat protein
MPKKTLFLLLLLIGLPLAAFAQPTAPPSSEEAQFAFARHLLDQQDYPRAITEFKRVLFLFPAGPRADEANFLLGLALFQSKAAKDALLQWQAALKLNPQTPFRGEIQLKMAKAYWSLGLEDEALEQWEAILQQGPSPLKPEAARALLWALIKQKRYDLARSRLKTLPLADSEKEIHESFFQKSENLPRKSPATAGFLAALLPGAGHWYLERYQDGLIAFTINGLFTWAAVSSFQQDNNGLGALLAFIELAWYSGNIYSAVNTAHKINKKQETDFLDQYGVRFGVLSQGPSSRPAPYLVFQYAF